MNFIKRLFRHATTTLVSDPDPDESYFLLEQNELTYRVPVYDVAETFENWFDLKSKPIQIEEITEATNDPTYKIDMTHAQLMEIFSNYKTLPPLLLEEDDNYFIMQFSGIDDEESIWWQLVFRTGADIEQGTPNDRTQYMNFQMKKNSTGVVWDISETIVDPTTTTTTNEETHHCCHK